ncbi:substrate-binding periplasmic protein [Endothiovibrio diazotrophicus]
MSITIKSMPKIVLFTFFIWALAGCYEKNPASISENKSKSLLDQIIERGEIRAGYISYPPSFIKDANTGKYSGIFYDALEEAAQNMGLKVKYTEEVDWATMTEAVADGRVDLVVSGIWPTSARALRADFTSPLYYSSVRAYVRADDKRFDEKIDLLNNNNITIAAIDGEMSSIIAKTDYTKAKLDSLPQTTQISQLLLEVSSGKADATFVELAVANEYIEKNPGQIRPISGVNPVRVFPNVMLLAKDKISFRSALNTAISELQNNGSIERILRKYEKNEMSFQRVAIPYEK